MLGYEHDSFQVAALREALWEFVTSRQREDSTSWKCCKCQHHGVIVGPWSILTLRRAHRAKSRLCRFSLYQVIVFKPSSSTQTSTEKSNFSLQSLTA